MLLDEVQTGIGRTGLMFACQHEKVVPDAMALAKGLGAGLPIGAMLVREKFANILTFPSHGSTFGGNPVACAAAAQVVKTVSSPEFLSRVRALECSLSSTLKAWKHRYPERINAVRGKGLLYGVEFVNEPGDFKERALAKGVIVNFCGERVMRIAPPLVITEQDLSAALGIVEELLHG
jgi:acetylornithine/succinyldiaminopimelate/putrescine aminotransferase